MRRLPPWSEPVANGAIPVLTATADPPDEPPQVRSTAKGLPVAPKSGFTVLAPMENSGMLVLPITMPPAARIRATMPASVSGTWSA